MKRLVLILAVAALIFGCADDIIIESPSEIRGYYEGEYESVTNYKVEGTLVRKQNILWTFTDRLFKCEYDTTSVKPQVFCDVSGSYELGDRLVFKDTIVEPYTCQHSDIPIGEFEMRRVGEDSLIISQWDKTKNTLKKLSLKKQE